MPENPSFPENQGTDAEHSLCPEHLEWYLGRENKAISRICINPSKELLLPTSRLKEVCCNQYAPQWLVGVLEGWYHVELTSVSAADRLNIQHWQQLDQPW